MFSSTMLGFRTLSSFIWLTIVERKSPHLARFCKGTAAQFSNMAYSIQESGSLHTQDYKIYLRGRDGLLSPFHDIPLYADKEKNIFNMIVEIPRWTNAKLEINKKDKLNPIKQDIKKGKVRFVNNVFPYRGYIWNYGAIPQTWEDPQHCDEDTKCKGDNDPLDVCEIGHKVGNRGEVKQVKILGTLALIDEGETDWKILAIDIKDPLAEKIDDISDIRKHMPGLLEATHEWFKLYKIPAGKPENEFAFNGEVKNRDFALKTVLSTHEDWKRLISSKEIKEVEDISRDNVLVEGSPFRITRDDANKIAAEAPAIGAPAVIPPEVDMWHFVPQSMAVSNSNSSN